MLSARVRLGGGPASGAALAAATRAGAAVILLRCEAGGESYCVEGARVAAIERADRIEREPGEHARVGWLSGHGADGGPVPVHSLAGLLGLSDGAAGGDGPVLVVGEVERWGLQVDRVTRAAVLPAEPPLALPAAVTAACRGRFTGALRIGDRLALVVAPERLRSDGADASDGPATPASAGSERPLEPPADRATAPAPVGPPRRAGAVALFSADPDRRHGGMLFGLSLAQVEEVLRSVPVTPVPGAADDLLGLVVWRGRAVPVIDLGRRFDPRTVGAGADPQRSNGAATGRLLVARAVHRPEWIAFPVRADLRVEPLPLPSRAWVDGPRISPLAALGVFELAAGTVVVPDVDRILTPDRTSPEGGRAARSAAEERGESDEKS